MLIRDVMGPVVGSVSPDTLLREAAERMEALRLELLPVCAEGRLVGQLTNEIVRATVANSGLASGSIRVRDAMSTQTVFAQSDVDVDHVSRTDLERFLQIPVIDSNGRLVGSLNLSALSSGDSTPAGLASIAVHAVESFTQFDDNRVDYMSDSSFPASDPVPPPTTLGDGPTNP